MIVEHIILVTQEILQGHTAVLLDLLLGDEIVSCSYHETGFFLGFKTARKRA